MQLDSRIGLISFAKSILWLAGGGTDFTCSGVIFANESSSLNQSTVKAAMKENFKRRVIESKIYNLRTENEGETFMQSSVLDRSADAYIREWSGNPSNVRADVGIRAPITCIVR